MKDMYNWINTIPVDEGEMEEMETTEQERERIKASLKTQISFNDNNIYDIKKNKKMIWQKRSAIAAAVVFLTLGGGAAVGVANPTFAASIPIIGDIFRFLDRGDNFTHYQEYSQHLSLAAEDKGITVKIEDAIFDGKNIFYTYSIKTDKDYGEQITTQSFSNTVIKGYREGLGGSSIIRQVDGNYYVGQDIISINEERKSVDLNIAIDQIYSFDKGEQVEGDWEFNFRLNAVKDNKMPINVTSKAGGVDINVLSLTNTPMSFLLDYKFSLPKDIYGTHTDIELKVVDNNGKEYETIGGSAYGENGVASTGSYIYGKIDEGAEYLLVTPAVRVASGGGGVAIDEDGNETAIEFNVSDDVKAMADLKFEPIRIDLAK